MTGPLGFSFRRTFRHTLSACKAVPSCSCVMRSSTLHRRSSILHPRAYLVGGGGGGGGGGVGGGGGGGGGGWGGGAPPRRGVRLVRPVSAPPSPPVLSPAAKQTPLVCSDPVADR